MLSWHQARLHLTLANALYFAFIVMVIDCDENCWSCMLSQQQMAFQATQDHTLKLHRMIFTSLSLPLYK